MADRSERFEIRLLGRVEIARDGHTANVGGRRQRALLALLGVDHNRLVPTDRLIDELWSGAAPGGAAGTLRSYVSRLRAVLDGDAGIRGSAAGYVLEVEPGSIDAVRFERRVRAAEDAAAQNLPTRAVELVDDGLGLWRGDPFAGLADEGALRVESERLNELRLRAIELRLEALLELGRAPELVDKLEVLVGRYPYRERLWRQLMLALYRSDRQADALAAYHRARAALDEELGLDPGQALRELEAQILRQEVPAPRPPEERQNLPLPLTTFVGRVQELQIVEQFLDDARIVTVTGVGGVGKTRLGVEAGRRAINTYPDGVAFVDLGRIVDPALVAVEAATAAGIADAGDATSTTVADRLRARSLLLILDNCEHLTAASAELAEAILRRCPNIRVLATSRVALGIPGEIAYSLPPLALATGSEAGKALPDAVELFLARASTARPTAAPRPDDVVTAARICADLEGLPLAIELAAARARALTIHDIAEGIGERFRFLVSWRRLATARHRTLREAMDWSYELLDPHEQQLLVRLSIFAGSFDQAAAAAICADGDRDRTLGLVERLVDASLVMPLDEAEAAVMRYRLLDTVREYAQERLTAVGVLEQLQDAHAAYFLALAEDRSEQVERELPPTPLLTLDVDLPNIRAALAHLEARGDDPRLLQMCAALWRFWWLRGYLSEGRRYLLPVLQRTAGVATAVRAKALRGAATLVARQGDREAGRRLADESVEVARVAGDEAGLVQSLMAAGNAASDLEEDGRAEALYLEASGLLGRARPGRHLAVLLLNRGDLALARGDLETAEQAATQSLAICREAGDDIGAAANLGTLAFVALERRDPEKARELATEAFQRAVRVGAAEWIVTATLGLAAVELALGDAQAAARLLGAADRHRAEIGAEFERYPQRVHAATRAATANALEPAHLDALLAEGRQMDTAAIERIAARE